MPTSLLADPRIGLPTLTTDAPAANTAAVVTLTAPASGLRHLIRQIDWSYSDDPTGGSLTIAYGSKTYVISITVGGPGQLHYPNGLGEGDAQAVTITLAAGGAGISGKLNVLSN